jgi:uncharacterized protein (TIGR00661 family)
MRILYGVVGEGMGHATRSRVTLTHLQAAGHEVEIVVSGRAHALLEKAFPAMKVHRIAGLNMIYEDNAVKKGRTALDFLKKLPSFGDNAETFERLDTTFDPQMVISDFESFSYLYGKAHDLPIASIDNMQVINRCEIDVEIPVELKTSFMTAKNIVKAKLPRCGAYVITSFFYPPTRKPRTRLVPPILRDAVLDAERSQGEHVLVYQTSDSFTELVPTLRRLPGTFVVYGLNRDEQLGNVTLKSFSEEGFVRDLASCRAVLAGGGYSLMGEAVYLGKPMLAVPLEGQFEQTLNALELQKLGYGEYHRGLGEAAIGQFLDRAPEYTRALSAHKQDRNTQLLSIVDELVARVEKTGRLVESGAD